MRWSTGFRASCLALAILTNLSSQAARAAVEPSSRPTRPSGPTLNIAIGFVGGFVRHDNPHHGPVIFANTIRRTMPGTYVRVFENRHRKQAYRTILDQLDTNRDGVLSDAEKSNAHIVLFGQSWGGSAAVLLARDLQRKGIPVSLTVQVDSVTKPWQKDSVIPANVSGAVNFYQTEGWLHGRREIRAADPSRTTILGNYLLDYKAHPVACGGYTWADRKFTAGHMQSECDPRVWSQIENLVRERLPSAPTAADKAKTRVQAEAIHTSR